MTEAEWRSLRAINIFTITALWRRIGEKPLGGLESVARAANIDQTKLRDVLLFAAKDRWETDDLPRRLGRWFGVHAPTVVILIVVVALIPTLVRARSELPRARTAIVVTTAAIEPEEFVTANKVAIRETFSIWRGLSTLREAGGRRAARRIGPGEVLRPSGLHELATCPTVVALRPMPPWTTVQPSDVGVEMQPCNMNGIASMRHAAGRMLLRPVAKKEPIRAAQLSDTTVDVADMAERLIVLLPIHASLPTSPASRVTLLAECRNGQQGRVIRDVIPVRMSEKTLVAAVRKEDVEVIGACSPQVARVVVSGFHQ